MSVNGGGGYSIEYTQGRRIGWMKLMEFDDLGQLFHFE